MVNKQVGNRSRDVARRSFRDVAWVLCELPHGYIQFRNAAPAARARGWAHMDAAKASQHDKVNP